MTSTSVSGSCSEPARRAVSPGTRLPALLLLGLLAVGGQAGARVFHAKDEALQMAFPGGTAITQRTIFLDDAQMAAIRERTGSALDSKLFTYYEGRRDGELVGYAVIDTHTVRTLPETFLVVLSPEGAITRVVVLAFYEPPEFLPADRWLAQFKGRQLTDGAWRVGRDVHGISGATLTAHAVNEGLQRILVLHRLVMRPAR